jgi:hypothetical protein
MALLPPMLLVELDHAVPVLFPIVRFPLEGVNDIAWVLVPVKCGARIGVPERVPINISTAPSYWAPVNVFVVENVKG